MAIRDYIYFTNDLKYITSQPKTEYTGLSYELEYILGGKVSVSQFGDIQFQPSATKNLFPLHLSASAVKSLSGIVLYLRHIAKKGHVVIIDEPELNLHPENQVLVARVLAKMANKGLRVIFSTHSDYIIRELSNLLILSNNFDGKAALKEKYNYSDDEILSKDKIKVYAFQNHTIEEVPITKQGIEIDKIEEVITKDNERSNDIYYTYLESTQAYESQTN